jgi:hypothetical protein
MAGGSETRRGVLRLLAGGALGSLTAPFGLAAAAAAKTPKRKRRTKGASQGEVQAEGKRKGKPGKKRKGKKKKCPACGACQVCRNGRCEEQIAPLCGPGQEVVCVNHRDLRCVATCDTRGERCDNGSCPDLGQCCPEEYQCDDGTCVDPLEECCPRQQRCANGECIDEDAQCPGPPQCGQCAEAVQEDGAWTCRPRHSGQPCGGVGTACCKGTCYSIGCGAGRHFNPDTCGCECDVVESCPLGKGWSHGSCSCVCNCIGRCCLSGCCTNPDGSNARCCQGS